MEKVLIMLVMFTACCALAQDLSGKVFTFPQETKTAHVRLMPSGKNFSSVTVCLRLFTDLRRDHVLFSLATPSHDNGFLLFKSRDTDKIQLFVSGKEVIFLGQDYTLNTWHSICSTWTIDTGLVQLWLDGKPSSRKFTNSMLINPTPIIILGQEQDSYGGGFDTKQSFVGLLSDVHMWDYVLSPCEIQRYMSDLNFTPGNVLNWRALEYQITGRVLLEDKQKDCNY